MRVFKFALVFLVLVVGAVVAFTGFYFRSCLGQMQACYASFRSATSGVDRATQERFQSIYAGFTASGELVAFPVPLEGGSNGIIFANPEADRIQLISTAGYSHWSPQLSLDGERLVFVRAAIANGERELVTCETNSWRCSILFRTRHPISTAVDVGNGYVLFAASQPRDGENERSKRFDIFAVRKGEAPARFTNYEMYEVQSLSVANGKILFGADGIRNFDPGACPRNDLKCDKSDIFALDFDQRQMAILNKPTLLKPLFAIPGYSLKPIISPDGKRVAFLNTNRQGNPYRYNTVISDTSGTVEGGVSVHGYAFSRSAFVGERLFINEVFPDHYRVLRIDPNSKKVEDFQIKHSPEFLKSVERIIPSFDGF